MSLRFLPAFLCCAALPHICAQIPGDDRPFALTHVSVIDGTGAALKPDQSVLVARGRIVTLNSSAALKIPPEYQVIDAREKFLIPGLWDMHVHTRYEGIDHLRLCIANGVTSVRDMGGPWSHLPELRQWREEIAKGQRVGPRIWAAGPLLDGPGSQWSHSAKVADPEEARQTVQRLKAEGADFVKVYDQLSRDSFFAIVEEAQRQGLMFVGHIPRAITTVEASDAGQRSIEHLHSMLFELAGRKPDGLKFVDITGEKAQAMAAALSRNRTAVVPTFSLYWTEAGAVRRDSAVVTPDRLKYIPAQYGTQWSGVRPLTPAADDVILDKGLALAREFHNHGVELLAGTDVVKPFFIPGFALQDELPFLAKAGLSGMQVLESATRKPARFMGVKDLGTVEPGMLADLVLLDANPLVNIENTKRIRAVVASGRLLQRSDLDSILKDVEASAKNWSGTPTGR